MNTKILQDYVTLLNNHHLLETISANTNCNRAVKMVTYNSKAVIEGSLFICKGAAFKLDYLLEAKEKGAIAYISEKEYPDVDLSCIKVTDIRKAMPYLGELFYDYPQEKLHIAGIGGTKGKSTTSYYIKSILDHYLNNQGQKESAIISSIDVYDGKNRYESHITTPENLELMEHFHNAFEAAISYLTMEVSSQALKYDRVNEINFDVSVFLNISEDHISPIEHPDFEDYFASKLKIFSQSKVAIVNKDADFSERILKEAEVCQKVLTFGYEKDCDLYAYGVEKKGNEIHFMVSTPEFEKPFVLTMPGLFNVDNALAAIGVALVYGIPYEDMYQGLYTARSSGRMELLGSKDKKVVTIVDYAHNKLSFQKLFASTREEYPGYKIIIIFGCPGKKALIRRRDLGQEAGKNADYIYLVAEDPGDEPVLTISKDIASYIEPYGTPYEMIEDRGEAIKKAVTSCTDKTVILITGKGNETRQKYGNQYLDCPSDVEYAKDALAAYDENHK